MFFCVDDIIEYMKNPLYKEQEKIDDYLITTCITLLGGFMILFSIDEQVSFIASILSIIATILITSTLLLSFWYKYRRALRNSIFEEKKKN